ncbi:DNA-binding transcriptional activator of the SARP family [Actinoplanes derwentensis]|uniref:DNA-binding transcriptional activator of the SARP family n=1 Tax=Actinoplanes derwentensis TaxID=113562 RepID=A0A1H2CWJ0_9ACTN|nr:DNA-binding transcriptional activator of the SARP family [Actinoplanes derwentensis]
MREFRLLGPVEVWADGRRLDGGPPQQRLVLAVLLAAAGRVVPAETLIARLWDDEPPAAARRAVYVHIARIRRVLREAGADGALVGASGGYRLDVDAGEVDLLRYQRLTGQARDRDDPREPLAEALACWRGTPLAGVPGRWAEDTRKTWSRLHLDTTIAWSRVADPSPAIDLLTPLVEEHPLVEPLAAALMRVLHRAGRTAEALDCFTRTRKKLVEELGLDPGSELAATHQMLLSVPTPAPAVRERPTQLPPDISAFVGRNAEMDALGAAADQSLIVISGTAGVGKTTLAVHWASTVADRFPDGILHVNLRGFDPSGTTKTPAEAIRGFLEAFDVPPQSVPVTLPAQTGLYRRLVAGRRVLVMLDNARDAEQVRPLLPNSPGCLAVVTSRHLLPALVVTDGAYPLSLDLLSATESRQLLTARLGAERVDAEPRSVDEIIDRCAGLPLAMTLIATRAAVHRRFELADLVGQLRAAGDRLDALSSVDRSIDVRTVFSWSYDGLSEGAAELFRLLGLHCGPDITAPAAAALLGSDTRRANVLLAELADAHLIVEHIRGRFGMHDLLRAYAAERFDDDPAGPLRRVLDYYLHSAYAADGLLYPHRDEVALDPPRAGVTPQVFDTDRQAAAWLDGERPVLLAAITQAASGYEAQAFRLALALVTFLDRRGHWDEMIAALSLALDAARRLGDAVGEGHSLRVLGWAYAHSGQYEKSAGLTRDALAVFEKLDDRVGQARAHRDLAQAFWRKGDHAGTLHHLSQVLRLSATAGLRAGPAFALYVQACVRFLSGDQPQAVALCRASVAEYRALGDRIGEAVAWEGRGMAHAGVGHHRSALICFRRALSLRRGANDRLLMADSLLLIGDTHAAAQRPGDARAAWLAAHKIFSELGHPDAERVEARLGQVRSLRSTL